MKQTDDTFLGLDPAEHTLERSRVVVLPVPYAETVSYRPGTDAGPAAIVAASAQMEDYDPELGREPCEVGVHTAAPIGLAADGPEATARAVADAVAAHVSVGRLVCMLGG
ncbi:MAG: arginase family protein, partial [Chloroflexi bacterium]|nr:arginase family protein [Chloroflexota bacterium]